jgi:hypothetical protein
MTRVIAWSFVVSVGAVLAAMFVWWLWFLSTHKCAEWRAYHVERSCAPHLAFIDPSTGMSYYISEDCDEEHTEHACIEWRTR